MIYVIDSYSSEYCGLIAAQICAILYSLTLNHFDTSIIIYIQPFCGLSQM